MNTYVFTIKGNHDDPVGNAIPKLKMTGRQHWMPKAQSYVRWKAHVVNAFSSRTKMVNKIDLGNDSLKEGKKKPIVIPEGKKAYMHLMIFWKDNRRADPENVFGSIADALFENDKYLAGSFDFETIPGGIGKVEVTIKI